MPSSTTQTRYPWRATVRTFVQTWVPLIVLVVLGLPEVVEAIDAEAGAYLPDHVRSWLLGLSTAAAVAAALAARLMALPGVGRVLDQVRGLGWLAAEPPSRGAHRDDDGDGIADGAAR
ncbi:hypothetical protein [Ornithinimicrobium avium]|uniref:Uncharacterized protein n=1 Tax=Ornithinimicrobium avium TaxID=2283195 RepID=A0A345NQ48_9MICO|nr:hypothetical protein [Ornithinimicrobium avium]AXH97156.1 hypothetical protein DV701_14445 [Ornithinimicrobium avium]